MTTWVSQYQKGKTSLDLNEARDDGFFGMQWHQLDHTKTICTSLWTHNHTNTSSLIPVQWPFFRDNLGEPVPDSPQIHSHDFGAI